MYWPVPTLGPAGVVGLGSVMGRLELVLTLCSPPHSDQPITTEKASLGQTSFTLYNYLPDMFMIRIQDQTEHVLFYPGSVQTKNLSAT